MTWSTWDGSMLTGHRSAFGLQLRWISSPMSRCSIVIVPATVSFRSRTLRRHGLPAAEGEQLPRQVCRATGRLVDLLQVRVERV